MNRSVLDGKVVDWCPRCGKTERTYPGVNHIQALFDSIDLGSPEASQPPKFQSFLSHFGEDWDSLGIPARKEVVKFYNEVKNSQWGKQEDQRLKREKREQAEAEKEGFWADERVALKSDPGSCWYIEDRIESGGLFGKIRYRISQRTDEEDSMIVSSDELIRCKTAALTEENMDKSSKDPGDWDGLAAWLSARKSSLISGPTNAYPDRANALTYRINLDLWQRAVEHFVPGWNVFRARENGYWVLERKQKPWTPPTKEALLKKQADFWSQIYDGLQTLSSSVVALGNYEMLTAYEVLKKTAERLSGRGVIRRSFGSSGIQKEAFFLAEEDQEASGIPTDALPFDQVVAFLKSVTPIVLAHAMKTRDNTVLNGLSLLAVSLRDAATLNRLSRDNDPKDYERTEDGHSYLAEENIFGA